MKEDYLKAKKIGDRTVRKALNEGRYPYLPSLSYALEEFSKLPKIPLGIHEIPLSMIVGTVTDERQNAFAADFMPILSVYTEFGTKWSNLIDSQQVEGIRDPIRCYEYMNRFYVLEGNKRVSVMKYSGAYSITADIERIMPHRTDEKDVQVYYEFLDFYKVTGLFEIVCTEPGSYQKLAAMYGMNLEQEWPDRPLEDIRSDFRYFLKSYMNKGGDKLHITPGEAFLTFRTIYRDTKLVEESESSIGQKIGNIWNELLSAANANGIVLLETPEAVEKRNSIFQGLLSMTPTYSKEKPLRVAFLYSKEAETSRWIYGHELGRNEINERFGGIVETIAFEDCNSPEKIDKAFAAAAADNDEVVFATSPDMMDAALRAAIRYPDMKILDCSINLVSSAVRTYYPKMYEAKFIMGALAAAYTDDHRIGYVADYPLNGTIAGVNAFAIGAGLVDPAAKIYLTWSGKKNSDWEKELEQDLGIRVISGPDMIRPDDPSRRYGVYKLHDDSSVKRLAAPIWNWGNFYCQIIEKVLDGSWDGRDRISRSQAVNYWFGIASGSVDVILSDELSYYSEKMVGLFKSGLLSGGLRPFGGELHSNKGEKIADSEHPELTNEEIIEMNWLNDNVVGEIPTRDELIESVQMTMTKSGIQEKMG